MIYFYKRFFGIIVSSIMIIILAPLLAMISIAIKIDSKGPIVFKQKGWDIMENHIICINFGLWL